MHNTEGRQACIFLSTHAFEPEIIPVQGEDILAVIRKMIGCEWVEVVRTRRLGNKYIMIVDEDGFQKDHPVFNEIGSYLYGIEQHGQPIVGDAVIIRIERDPDGSEGFEWLNPEEAEILTNTIRIGLRQFVYQLRQKEGKPQ